MTPELLDACARWVVDRTVAGDDRVMRSIIALAPGSACQQLVDATRAGNSAFGDALLRCGVRADIAMMMAVDQGDEKAALTIVAWWEHALAQGAVQTSQLMAFIAKLDGRTNLVRMVWGARSRLRQRQQQLLGENPAGDKKHDVTL